MLASLLRLSSQPASQPTQSPTNSVTAHSGFPCFPSRCWSGRGRPFLASPSPLSFVAASQPATHLCIHGMMAAVNRSIRTATRSLRLRSTPLAPTLTRTFGPSLASSSAAATISSSRPLYHHHQFSTTTARMSSPPMPTQHKGYDPEITDIAKYVTQPINSDLAVSLGPR